MGVSIVLSPLHLDVDQYVDVCHSGKYKIVFYYDINLHVLMTNKFRHLFNLDRYFCLYLWRQFHFS